MVKISIIIPTYNHGKELSSCLDSIFAQTILSHISPLYKGGLREVFEIIIVNDGSTDGTEKILEEYIPPLAPPYKGGESAFKKEVIKIVTQANQGAPAARNNGFKASSGEFLLFCDADIELRKDALEKMLKTLEIHPDASYAYPNFKFGIKKIRIFPFDSEKLKKMNYIHTTALIRRENFPETGFDKNLKKFQDWDLWLIMLKNEKKGIWIDEFLFTVKERKSGISQWMPRIMYKIPWKKFGIKIKAIEKYEYWRDVVREKHGLG